LQIGISKRETLLTPYGEFIDLINCHAISKGLAEPAKKKKWTFEEVMALR